MGAFSPPEMDFAPPGTSCSYDYTYGAVTTQLQVCLPLPGRINTYLAVLLNALFCTVRPWIVLASTCMSSDIAHFSV